MYGNCREWRTGCVGVAEATYWTPIVTAVTQGRAHKLQYRPSYETGIQVQARLIDFLFKKGAFLQ